MEQLNKQEQKAPQEKTEVDIEQLKSVHSSVTEILDILKNSDIELSEQETQSMKESQEKLLDSIGVDPTILAFATQELYHSGQEISSDNLIKGYIRHLEKTKGKDFKSIISKIRELPSYLKKGIQVAALGLALISGFTQEALASDNKDVKQTDIKFEGDDTEYDPNTTYQVSGNEGGPSDDVNENESTSPEMISANLDLDLVFEKDKAEAPTEHVKQTINEFLDSEDLAKVLEKIDLESKINLKIVSAASPEPTNNWDEDSARKFIEDNKLTLNEQEIENIISQIAKGEVPDGQEGNAWLSFLRGKFLQSSLIGELENLANNGNENAAKLLSSVAEINIENHVTEETDFDENTGLYIGKITELQGKTWDEVRAALNGVSFEMENIPPFIPEIVEANLIGNSFSEKGLSNINELFSSYNTENGESESYDATILNNQDQVSNLIKKSLADYIDGKIQEEISTNGSTKHLKELQDIRSDFLKGELSKDLRQFISEANLSNNFIVAGAETSGDLATIALKNNFPGADGDIAKALESIKNNTDGKYNIVSYDRVVADMETMKELSATDTDFTLLTRNPGNGQAEGFKISSSDLYEYMQDAEKAGKLRVGTGVAGQRLAMVGSVDLDNIKTWLTSQSK